MALLQLLFLNEDIIHESNTDHMIFGSGISAFELEDLLIERNFKQALKTIHHMREKDHQNSAPIIWIIAKVINSCLESLKSSNKKSALVKSGVWRSKIDLYLRSNKKGKNERIFKIK